VPGGSNDYGEAEPYNASAMAAHQNAIITSINYRVGPFGFVALREDQQAGKPTGNHALTDMQAALTFLRAHIGSFGGDPSRLTMFGQSSGAGLVLLHTVIPSSASLFEGVVGQSNGLSADSFNYSLATTATLAKALNCTTRGYKTTKACLLAATDDELTYAQGVVCMTPNDCSANTNWAPTVDGHLVPHDPDALLDQGKVNPAHIAFGANTNDSFLFIKDSGFLSEHDYLHGLRAQAYGDKTIEDELVSLYPPHANASADNIDRKGWYSSDRNLCGLRTLAARFAKVVPTFFYRYNWWFQSNRSCYAVSNWHPPEFGSMHQDEVSFVFGMPIYMNTGYSNCSLYDPSCIGCAFDEREDGFSRAVGRLWTNFAASGNPNVRAHHEEAVEEVAGAHDEWPSFGPSGGRNVYLHPEEHWREGVPQRMTSEDHVGRPRECAVWDRLAELAAGLKARKRAA